MPPKISIIIPVYNEEKNVEELFRQIERSLDNYQYTYEVIFVNDGSTDNTWNIIKGLSKSSKTLT